VKLSLRVQPGAPKSRLLGRLPGGVWKVAVAAPPVEGRANAAVVELMSELLAVPKRRMRIARGDASRSKTIEVEGIDAKAAEARLAAALAAGD